MQAPGTLLRDLPFGKALPFNFVSTHLPGKAPVPLYVSPYLPKQVRDVNVRNVFDNVVPVSLEELWDSALITLSSSLALSTWKTRQRAWHQLLEFLGLWNSTHLPGLTSNLPVSCVLFLEQRRRCSAGPKVLLGVASALHTILGSMDPLMDRTILSDYMAAIRKTSSLEATLQALPIPVSILRSFILSLPTAVERIPFVIAWITSSRWNDVERLVWNDILIINNRHLLVSFWRTKTSVGDWRTDTWVPILDAPPWILDVVRRQRACNGVTPITTLTTENVRKLLSKLPVPPQWMQQFQSQPVRLTYTGHSIKRGAQTLLWRILAANPHYGITPWHISQIAKHKLPTPVVATTTAAYAADKFAFAVGLGLHLAPSALLESLFPKNSLPRVQ
jgi:hypothetical protein